MYPLLCSVRSLPRSWSALALFALAVMTAGCGDDDTAPGPSDTGPATCAPGEAPLDDGRCQPAGLPLDMPCPPGEMPLDGGRCQPAGLPPDMPCPPGEMPLDGGGCQPAGVPPDMPCAPGEMPLPSGSCQRAGVPPVACGQGFEPDGRRGCEPILPEGMCPPGQMAIPGDVDCEEVAPCGDGDYGSIPVDATTQFVNGAYAGTDSDGTRAKPWKRIQEGIDHARASAIVAVAAGIYAEDLRVRARRVRLWGRCPSLVEVVGTGEEVATLAVVEGAASGSEVRALAITGPGLGFFTTGASDVIVEHVWIHDTRSEGLHVEDTLGPTSVAVRASLIEGAEDVAVGLIGSETTFETTVIRDTQPGRDGTFGVGIVSQNSAQGRARLALRRSLLEQNRTIGVYILGSDATIEATVLRDTQPDSDGMLGRGLEIEYYPETLERANVTVRESLLEHNHEFGVFVAASDATIETTVVRDTQPHSDGTGGAAIEIEDDGRGRRAALALRTSLLENNLGTGLRIEGSDATVEATVVRGTQPSSGGSLGRAVEVLSTRKERAALSLRTSLLEHNHDTGVLVEGASAEVEATVVRDTEPAGQGTDGIGIRAQGDRETGERALLTLRASLLEQNRYLGVHVLGSDATIEESVVRDTQPHSDGTAGHGIAIQHFPATRERAKATLRAVRLSQNHEVGVLVAGSDATIEATVVRDTRANRDGSGGYGVAIQYERGRSEVAIRASSLEKNREFGISVHASDATIEATVVRDTQSNGEGAFGRGVGVFDDPDTHERAKVALRTSLVDQNHDLGVLVSGSDATLEATVVRGTRPSSDTRMGRGIEIHADHDTLARAKATLRFSVVEHNHDTGVLVAGSDATVEATVVRDTQPGNVGGGSGIVIQDDDETHERSTVALHSALVERNHDIGVVVLGSDATVDATVVRDTQPRRDGWGGHGIHVQENQQTHERATATLRGVLVEHNHSFGVTIFDSDAAIEASAVRATQGARDETRGDGIAVRSYGLPANATITSTVVDSNARAGISSFSAAVVLVSSAVQCNRIDLNGEDLVEGQPFTFDGSKENLCGCGDEAHPTCAVLSANLSPPEPISPARPTP
ncbi:right-handed parallel beta-helix repeat-containing protein [Sorangium sp. So ce1389]|uniref:right-handed parallel beta-helix repeat-containing protein n=1 Tax=Sorangium sp. So ce1389 TaxID=3133336 RepID=UPI003F5F16C0